MNYTAQVRKDIKRECKARVKERLGSCVGIQFLFALPFVLLTVIMVVAIYGGLFSALVSAASAGVMLTDEMLTNVIVNNMMHGAMNTIWVATLVSVIISGPLTYGLMKFYIGLRHGEEPHAGILFKPFTSGRSLWTGMKMSFCLTFRALLWVIVPVLLWVIVFIAVIISSAVGGSVEPPMGFIFASYFVLLIAMIPIEIKVMTYQAGWLIVNNDEETGVWAATREASHVFKGHYGKLVVFALSFILWYLLMFGVVYGCFALGAVGIALLGPGSGAAVLIVSVIAGLCLDVVLSAFVNTYVNTSFIGLYEYFKGPSVNAAAPEYAQPFYSAPASAPISEVPQAPAPQPKPEQTEEAPASPEDDGSADNASDDAGRTGE
ncbi:DUF975 family protein [Agathobaculum sp.]|uniref:DUF975 family protein n=1 Tax=Agathobaculum sp. TaxID=2048138 RepID=UPI002A7F679D|nr:DUF975 family protein [Agathobaculum sp.]MDY3619094.1 DUF975 family protein [Agathobaculum sp.]